jgi:hypothetical protein
MSKARYLNLSPKARAKFLGDRWFYIVLDTMLVQMRMDGNYCTVFPDITALPQEQWHKFMQLHQITYDCYECSVMQREHSSNCTAVNKPEHSREYYQNTPDVETVLYPAPG